mmetsp:Transcript_778/g.1778  ORF Transcript_778/g.1778 Transcript_778/m.1778 type:complete len:111 (+) Transcript_778:592-924(+)
MRLTRKQTIAILRKTRDMYTIQYVIGSRLDAIGFAKPSHVILFLFSSLSCLKAHWMIECLLLSPCYESSQYEWVNNNISNTGCLEIVIRSLDSPETKRVHENDWNDSFKK